MCVCERERERESMFVYVCVCLRVCLMEVEKYPQERLQKRFRWKTTFKTKLTVFMDMLVGVMRTNSLSHFTMWHVVKKRTATSQSLPMISTLDAWIQHVAAGIVWACCRTS